jgi:transcriptional regulator with GAF, ATPase, and Fis domain/tetratricopeptide (TPR) repeat protein
LADGWQRLERAGQGTTSEVWKARHPDGRIVALKTALSGSGSEETLGREAALLARTARRWGPALVDASRGWLAIEWVEGAAIDPRSLEGDREKLAAVVAHGVGRALEELHDARVRHGDVKPANVILSRRIPTRDSASDRGATLVDLGLSAVVEQGAAGGTLRYAAPELRQSGEGSLAGDLWALGVLLAEVLDLRVALAADPLAAMRGWDRAGSSEPARWAEALVSRAAGGRPSASWVASRAARWLGLGSDPAEQAVARVDRVRRAYLAERGRDVTPGASLDTSVDGPARAWLSDAIDWAGKLAPPPSGGGSSVGALTAVRRGRWTVRLVGSSAAAWPFAADRRTEGELAARFLDLARSRDPASWTFEDVLGATASSAAGGWESGDRDDRVARLVCELARAAPSPAALALAEDEASGPRPSPTLALQLARALARAGEAGRAWVALEGVAGPEVDALRAEVARRRGDGDAARACARRAIEAGPGAMRSSGQATLARMAWDEGDLVGAEKLLDGASGPSVAEVRALVAWRRGAAEPGLRGIENALAEPLDGDVYARLESIRGALELARGGSAAALVAFARAVELAARAGAVVDEASYLTSQAAGAADAGDVGRALESATRSALLWERLGRPAQAANAWLARAAALATIGADHLADEAAEEAIARAGESGAAKVAAYARWAQVEVRPAGDPRARALAVEASRGLDGADSEDRVRAGARLLVWAPDGIDDREIAECDRAALRASPPARWEWWGARAHALLEGRAAHGDVDVLSNLRALLDVPALLSSRGPALDAGVRLATERGDGELARRFEVARREAARVLREGTPAEHRASLAAVTWARSGTAGTGEVAFAPAQVAELEGIVRSLSRRDGLRRLLEQVLDTMVLWTGVERGLLLLRAPDGRLVPRAARNLARHDLSGEQLALSQTIARRAVDTGDAVVATDAFSTLGDVHASVHALRLRSVLAVPLAAHGETFGVVYLDDRVRKGAFGPAELAWVRVVASQAAMAIADARDTVLLKRAVRREERARARIEGLLAQRDAELEVTRTQLDLARDSRETRYAYDEIAGRSEPMRDLLRLVDRVTASEVPVLVVGESGTGKELVARAMHSNGPRARQPFVTENCASVPETLLESTLFGHVRGAFTGASSTRAGLFDVADGGTLFLDEIGEMSLAMQAKLLRVLQDGEVRPVGGERSRKVDVRVIAATHRDLTAMVAAGTFREDLFYRLDVITLKVPPLRERTADIPLLVEHFVKKHASGKGVKVTRAAMAKLVAFPWPGNVRQLENEVRRALVLADGAVDVAELSADVARGGPPGKASGSDLRSRVDALEAELVSEALAKTRGNQTKAAQALGLSRFGLQKMMKRLGIATPGVS